MTGDVAGMMSVVIIVLLGWLAAEVVARSIERRRPKRRPAGAFANCPRCNGGESVVIDQSADRTLTVRCIHCGCMYAKPPGV